MLDAVPAAALEVAGTAVLALGPDYGLHRRPDVAPQFICDLLFTGVLGFGKGAQVLEGLLPVDSLLAVAVQAVDRFGLCAPSGMQLRQPLSCMLLAEMQKLLMESPPLP